MRKGCLASLVFVVLLAAGLIFAATFYTSERVWSAGSRVGEHIIRHPPLAGALRECLAAHDPAALAVFIRTGAYPTSGWFLDDERRAAVMRCMRRDGWLLVPTRLYTP